MAINRTILGEISVNCALEVELFNEVRIVIIVLIEKDIL